jgi:cysteine desulfurase
MIYLDYNATAPLRREAREAMEPYLSGPRGNAASLHALGRQARAVVERARADVAAFLGTPTPESVVFTSGATESDVWALRGVFDSSTPARRNALWVTAVEHPAVLDTALSLSSRGVHVRVAPVDSLGRLIDFKIKSDTRLVAVMAANNETGNLYDVGAIAERAHAAGAMVHCDAVQLAGRLPLDVEEWGVEFCAISAHKIGGPCGVGALYIRPGTTLAPLLTGGGHENGRRSGTLNVAGIVGFAAAARAAAGELGTVIANTRELRDRMQQALIAKIPGATILGDMQRRLPNTLMLSVPGVKGEAVVVEVDANGVAIATGAACSSGSGKPSHVLSAMNLGEDVIAGALRISLGSESRAAEIDTAVDLLAMSVSRLRALA